MINLMADIKSLLCTFTLLLLWLKRGYPHSTDQGHEATNNVKEGCPNSQYTEYYINIFGREYDNQNDNIDLKNYNNDDDVSGDVMKLHSERSCKKRKIYNKTRKKLKGSKNHRKRLKKKKKFHKSVRKRNNKMKYK